MELIIENIIFAVLKVARGSSLEQAFSHTHNNINRIEFRPATQYAYLMRFFIVLLYFLVQHWYSEHQNKNKPV